MIESNLILHAHPTWSPEAEHSSYDQMHVPASNPRTVIGAKLPTSTSISCVTRRLCGGRGIKFAAGRADDFAQLGALDESFGFASWNTIFLRFETECSPVCGFPDPPPHASGFCARAVSAPDPRWLVPHDIVAVLGRCSCCLWHVISRFASCSIRSAAQVCK